MKVLKHTRNRNMSNVGSKTFQDAIKPLVYLNYFVGVSTFRLPNQSNFTYNCIKLYEVIITIISWAVIYISWISLRQITEYENAALRVFAIQKVLDFALACFAAIALLLVWLRSKGLRNCLRETSILDDAFQVVRGPPNECRKQYTLIIRRIIAILLFTIFSGTLYVLRILELAFRNQMMFWIAVYAVHHQLLIMLVLDLNFCTLLRYLGQKFQDMNNNLLGLTEKPFTSCRGKKLFDVASQNIMRTTLGNEVKNTETDGWMNEKYCLLREARRAHLELCKLARMINCAFDIQILLSMGISFAMITGMLFSIYTAFVRGDFTNVELMGVIGIAIWTATFAYKIWVVNHCCRSVSTEAEKTGEIIYELLDTIVDREFQQEIQEFGIQMLHNPVRFDAYGFFTLDHTFVQGVIASVTTYLVILIQMSPESRGFTFSTSHAGNDTKVSVN